MKPKTIQIELTIDEALECGIALALAEYIDTERFEAMRKISFQICRQIEKIMEAEKSEERTK